jgi:hypothetical protein
MIFTVEAMVPKAHDINNTTKYASSFSEPLNVIKAVNDVYYDIQLIAMYKDEEEAKVGEVELMMIMIN